ncbi:deaminase domain-containing protein [Ideonella alba]|uniref:deaminase domain-containing protein n=1 Tax=Ideonella alba TaxID=2824118 RepID=UPI001FFD08B1|nr:deaminase domain-containing protein [Ideonella alba]
MSAPDQSDAETARLNRYEKAALEQEAANNRTSLNAFNRENDPYYSTSYENWPDQTEAETARLNRYEAAAVDQERSNNRTLLNQANRKADRSYYHPMPQRAAAVPSRAALPASDSDLLHALGAIAKADFLRPVDQRLQQAYANATSGKSGLTAGPVVMGNAQLVGYTRAHPGDDNAIQRWWNSDQTQQLRRTNMSGALLFAAVDQVGDSLGGLTGYNPVSNSYYLPNEQQSAAWRTVAAVASFALPEEGVLANQLGGARTIGNIGSVAEEAPALTYLSNSTAPEIRARLVAASDQLRADLPWGGNVGIAEVNVPAYSSETTVLKAYSGIDSEVGEMVDWLAKPPGDASTWTLQPRVATAKYLDTPEGYLRNADTEFKILENVSQRLQGVDSPAGTINLYSEKLVCPSCSDVVNQFRTMYPNVQLNVFTKQTLFYPG